MRRLCNSASDRHGRKIYVGSKIRYLGYGEVNFKDPVPVKVTAIYRQGADGTILETAEAPNPDYPSHFSCRASETEAF